MCRDHPVVHAGLIRYGANALDEPTPSWPHAIVAGLCASWGAFFLALPLSCTFGCLVGMISYPASMLLQGIIGASISGWILSRMLSIPLEKGLTIQTVWWCFILALWTAIWIGARMTGIWF